MRYCRSPPELDLFSAQKLSGFRGRLKQSLAEGRGPSMVVLIRAEAQIG